MDPRKPIVGVMPLWDEEKESLWMLPGYLDGIVEAGALPIIFPFASDETKLRQLMSMCDGFLFTGGQDVSPSLYREEPLDGLVHCCDKRDAMETTALKIALEADKPVLGICRGIQLINVCLGGTLYQDIPSQYPSGTNHHGTMPYDRPVHEVAVLRNTPLYELLRKKTIGVNSYHHQAIKNLAPPLKAMATSEDGIIEAVYMPGKRYLWAVQWHPEFSYKVDEPSRKIFRSFVKSMEGHQA